MATARSASSASRSRGAGIWPWLGLAAMLATASILALAWAYARAPASYLAPVEYTAFLWAALLGWLVFGEHVQPLTVAGAVLRPVRREPAPLLFKLVT